MSLGREVCIPTTRKHLTCGLTSLEGDLFSGSFWNFFSSFLIFFYLLPGLLLSFPGNLTVDVRVLEGNRQSLILACRHRHPRFKLRENIIPSNSAVIEYSRNSSTSQPILLPGEYVIYMAKLFSIISHNLFFQRA